MVKNKLLVTNNLIGNTISVSMIQRESSLFSSSLSEMFVQKLRLEGNQQNTCHVPAHYDEASFAHLEDLGRQTIGNLLPDEDDLFSGGTEGLNIKSDKGDEMEDYDLFSAIGGMELEGNHQSCAGQRNADLLDVVLDGERGFSTSTVGHLCVGHPSRMLFVRNIDSHVKDSELKGLFEKYGDIRSLYTACKHRGFVLISYYDIRAAENAMRTLKNEPLRRRKLDIHYSIPKVILSDKDIHHGTLVVTDLDHSVSSDELQEMLGGFGDIKEIFKIQKTDHKYVEYYDIRAAEAALCVLNRGNIAGKHIRIEPVHPRVTSLVSSFGQEDKTTIFRSPMNGISPGQKVYPGSIASACLDNGFARDFNTFVGSPMSSFTESLRSSSAPTGLRLHASATPIHMQSSFKEQNRYLDHINLGNQPLLNLHPQSLLVYPDTLTNKFPCNSSTSITDIPRSIGIRMTEGSSHIWGVKSNATLMEATGAMFGPSGNGGRPSQPTNYMWSNSSPRKHHPSNAMHRQSSYPFVNRDLAEHLVDVNAFQSASAFLSARSGIHHIGSAPPVSSYFWDGQQTYTAGSPDVSRFDSGSLGSMSFPGSSPSHSDSAVEITSQNFVSHIGDMAKNGIVHVPHQICHLFSGRNPIISMPASLDSPNGHLRNFLHRRNEVNSNGADNKQYELNIDRIIRGEDFRTTLMIKNIPNKYNSKMLLAAIDEHCRGTYDFVYLPIDFKNKCNVGYAFINIINSPQIIPFYKAFNGKKWEKFNSEKVAYLAYARIQGKAALIAHFQNSSLMNEDKRCRPILFHTDGPNAGDQEPFPMGTNIPAQPGRSRASLNEVNCQDGFSTSENGLESSDWTRSSLDNGTSS